MGRRKKKKKSRSSKLFGKASRRLSDFVTEALALFAGHLLATGVERLLGEASDDAHADASRKSDTTSNGVNNEADEASPIDGRDNTRRKERRRQARRALRALLEAK